VNELKPEIIVMGVYWLFAFWMYTIATKGKQNEFKTDSPNVITVFPTNEEHIQPYKKAYVHFHMRIMILSGIMGIACAVVGRLLPLIIGSLVFFAYLNLYKFQVEEKLRLICGGEELA